jgi:hypothetical protein
MSTLYLCVLGNPKFPDHLRIGIAADPVQRLSDFNDGDPGRAYFYESVTKIQNARTVWMRLCYSLRVRRASGYWFKLTPTEASGLLKNLYCYQGHHARLRRAPIPAFNEASA